MTKQVLQQALRSLEVATTPLAKDRQEVLAAIEALRSALAQQPELSTASKSEQLLASHDHALRAEFQRMKAALSQQGEQQPVAWMVTTEKQDGTRETYPITGRYKDVQDVCDFGEPIPLYAGAAPAAQPTCNQDLQVPTVKENLTTETEQERYVRMCPDIECGRKKQCTRMVGVSCMSRADIAPAAQPDTLTDDGGWTSPIERQIIQTQITKDISAAQPDDAIIRAWQAGYYHAGYTNDQAYADKMAREYAGAAPAAQPDTRTVVQQMVGALCNPMRVEQREAAIQAGQKWLEELK